MNAWEVEQEQQLLAEVLTELRSVFLSHNPLFELLHKKTLQSPARCAVTDGNCSLSYAELFHRALICAQFLADSGVVLGQHVVLHAPNIPLFYVWYHALHAIGAIVVLVPFSLHEREVVRILEQAKPSVIISDASKMQQLFSCAEHLSKIPVIDILCEASSAAVVRDCGLRGRGLDEVAIVLYTSGSTGEPAGVALSVKNILTNAAQSLVRTYTLGLDDAERFLVVLPLTHSFGHMTCLWLPLINGATVYVLSAVTRKNLLHAFSVFKPTVFFLVPALVGLMCTLHSLQLESVKIFISGGDFLSSKLAAGFEQIFGRRICSGYGLSEASPVVGVSVNPRSYSSGIISPLLPGIGYKIEPTGSSDVGELLLRGDSVFKGYFNGSCVELKSNLNKGWLPTGDLVKQLSDGSLVMIGRSKEIIVFKAFNIYPQEVERVLLLHSCVIFAVVVGLEHELFGQIPVAAVVLKSEVVVDSKELVLLCRAHLASYKIPHRILFFNEMPLNHLGKVDRKIVKKMMES